MTIIDTHAHIYPDAIATKAAGAIAAFYHIPSKMDGTLDALKKSGEAGGISRFLVHSVATTPHQVLSINDYIISVAASDPARFIGFGAMHPSFPDIKGELKRMKQSGLKGVKLHPDFQRFLLDSDESILMLRYIAEAGLPVLVHMGDYRYPYSRPERMARVMDALPDLRVIGAHLGGWSIWREAWKTLADYPRFWVDTSSSLSFITPEEAVAVIRHYGADRAFFGSDYPMWNPAEEVARFMALPLKQDEKEAIAHRNFEAFMGEGR